MLVHNVPQFDVQIVGGTNSCCNHDGIRGDANLDNAILVDDLVLLVDYLFKGGPPPDCYEEGDTNADTNILVDDLTLLVDSEIIRSVLIMTVTIRKKWTTGAIAILLFAGLATPAVAHHSYAMYDTAVEKTLTGKLVRYIPGANHSQYVMQVVDPDGKPVIWNVETQAGAQLARLGITVENFRIGTIFTVTLSPVRDGRNRGAQRGTVLIMCGRTLPAGGCNEKTGRKYGQPPKNS